VEDRIKMNVMVLGDYGMTFKEDLDELYLDHYLVQTHGLHKLHILMLQDMDQIQYVILQNGYASIIPYALTYEKVSIIRLKFLAFKRC